MRISKITHTLPTQFQFSSRPRGRIKNLLLQATTRAPKTSSRGSFFFVLEGSGECVPSTQEIWSSGRRHGQKEAKREAERWACRRVYIALVQPATVKWPAASQTPINAFNSSLSPPLSLFLPLFFDPSLDLGIGWLNGSEWKCELFFSFQEQTWIPFGNCVTVRKFGVIWAMFKRQCQISALVKNYESNAWIRTGATTCSMTVVSTIETYLGSDSRGYMQSFLRVSPSYLESMSACSFGTAQHG